MSWKIWKKPEERLEEEWNKAVNLRNQAKWKEASEQFLKVAKLAEEVSDPQLKKQGSIALALAALYKAVENRTADNFKECYSLFSKLDPETILEIPYKVKAAEVAEEARILAEEASLPKIELSKLHEYSSEIADKYEALAKSYLGLRREKMLLSDLFQIEGSVSKKAFKYLGFSKLLKGKAEEKHDPGKSVQYYSEAMGYFSQAMLKEYQDYADQRSRKLSSVAKCWFCGRDVQGEEVHYVYMKTILTPYLINRFGEETPPTMRESKIVVCSACYNAIHILADTTARAYYEKAMAALREVEERLLARIRDLEARIRYLERSG